MKFLAPKLSLNAGFQNESNGEILDLAITDLNQDKLQNFLSHSNEGSNLHRCSRYILMKRFPLILLILLLASPAYSFRKPHFGGELRVADTFIRDQ